MTSWLLPLLLPLLLSGPPAVRPAPPTCYSRMLGLSREITGDFQSLQAMEPSVSSLRPAEDQQVQCRPSSQKFAFTPGKQKKTNKKTHVIFLFWSLLISRAFVF